MNPRKINSSRTMGFSIIELMMTILVLAIIIGIAVPSYKNFMNQKRARSVTEELYNYIKIAQSEALTTKNTVYLSFSPSTWCYGLSDTGSCDCTTVNSCQINSIQTIVNSSDYSGNATSIAVTGFSGAASNPSIVFDGYHGTINVAGSITVSLSNQSATISANTMGLVTICSNTISGYSACP